ncbi:MAG: argininosuccinate lyase [Desulfosudaceae bacterium]
MTNKSWGGRFSEKTDQAVEAFTSSVTVDRRLAKSDIRGSIAHCRMLARQNIIEAEEAETIISGLRQIDAEIESGRFEFSDALEDVHMNVEQALFEKIGPPARRLHTGRSRNDQVALDARLCLREDTRAIMERLREVRRQLLACAGSHLEVIMPGYTHLQRAQPVLFSHHLMAYYEMFTRDTRRFADSFQRTNVMPLGSAALAGTTYPLDREYVASQLGFDSISANSMDAVSDRDFMLEFLSAASICMMHLSRLSEEIVLWSSAEFRFVTLSDAFATGSSIMPQKKNPDVPELIRGKTGRVFGDLTALLTTMKSLPLCYNRDMQEDKPPLFDAVDTLSACLDMAGRMIGDMTVNGEAMRRAASSGFLNATDMADYLVGKGLPFRDAHACVGKAVAAALDQGRELDELPLETLKTFSEYFEADLFEVLSLEQIVNRRDVAGGTSTDRVRAAIAGAEKDLAGEAPDEKIET